ncbi:MAG: aminotransferase class V-fold PLP-dependent enzyme [Candidatus Woesearchaeota archaeon]
MRQDFPILKNNKELSYLDNAATTQKPNIVIDALKEFYESNNANAHRGVYKLSENASIMLDDARKKFAEFINAKKESVIFTKNTTEGLNMLANSLEKTFVFDENENIIVTEIEHHSNFVPWQQLCKRTGGEFRVVPYNLKKENIENIEKYVDDNTKIVAFTAMSNVTGLIIDVKLQIKSIRKKNKNAIIIIDATQYVAHNKLNIQEWDADFIVFSAHKVYGTTGVGIIYAKQKFLEEIAPFLYGGNMISSVTIEQSEWAEIPDKFEAGTIDTAGIFASSKAIDYFQKNFREYKKIEEDLKYYALKRLKKIKGIKIFGHNTKDYGPVISFAIEGIHPHDLATICDRHNVCIRSGHHCAQPFMKKLKVPATSRVSISFYNNTQDIDKLIDAIEDAKKILKIKG